MVELLTLFIGKELIQPDRSFRSTTGQSCVKGSIKAQTGWLYFLKKSMVFIPKMIFNVRIEAIHQVELLRTGTSSRLFDIRIVYSSISKPI